IIPAAAAVVFALLHVAGGRQVVDVLAGQLPAVDHLLHLGAGHAGVLGVDPIEPVPQLDVAEAMQAAAEDVLLGGDLADRGLVAGEFYELVAENVDRSTAG